MHTHSQKYGEELRCHVQSLLFNGKQNKLQIIMTGEENSKLREKGALGKSIKQFPNILLGIRYLGTMSVLKKEKETKLFIICTGLV